MSKSVAVFGTSSGVGKTTIMAAMCRYLRGTGRRVFPFKAFNLSANAFSRDGLQVGWAQYIQAAACGREYDASMNPVFCLFSQGRKRFIINGEETDLSEVNQVDYMREVSSSAFEKAMKENDIVVVEGSGSCCELNLAGSDVANMHFAARHNIPVILTGSIADGGIFGSLYGTLALLSDDERALVKGIIVNRFFGNMDFFQDGRAIIERTCGKDILSVMPHIQLNLPEEDRGPRMMPEDVNQHNLRQQLDMLADVFTRHTDLERLEKIVEEGVTL